MGEYPCDECRAIESELKNLFKAAKAAYEQGAPRMTLQEFSEWIGSMDTEEIKKITESSPFGKIRTRAREHRTLTGHTSPVEKYLAVWQPVEKPENNRN